MMIGVTKDARLAAGIDSIAQRHNDAAAKDARIAELSGKLDELKKLLDVYGLTIDSMQRRLDTVSADYYAALSDGRDAYDAGYLAAKREGRSYADKLGGAGRRRALCNG